MSNKPKREQFVSPPGLAVWPRLNEPDTKFKAEGEYSVSLAYDEDDQDFRKLEQRLERIRDELFEAFISENPKKKKVAQKAPVAVAETDENGEETGRMLLKFKMLASGKSKKTGKSFKMRPRVFDGRGQEVDPAPNIGGGSKLKVSFEVLGTYVESARTYYLSLRMQAVKVIELVQFGARSAKDYGFDGDEGEDAWTAEDGGFERATAPGNDESDADDSGEDDGNY